MNTQNLISILNTITYDDLCELPFNYAILAMIESNLDDAINELEFNDDTNTLYNVLINLVKLCRSHYQPLPSNKSKITAFYLTPLCLLDVLLENFDDDDDNIIESDDVLYIDNVLKSYPKNNVVLLFNELIKFRTCYHKSFFPYRFNLINHYTNTFNP